MTLAACESVAMEFVAGSIIICSASLLALGVARAMLEALFYAIDRSPRITAPKPS